MGVVSGRGFRKNTQFFRFCYVQVIVEKLKLDYKALFCKLLINPLHFPILTLSEHMVGATCNIVVTQPRRISAISIAERVAAERREMVGKTVGYQVRQGKRERLTYHLFNT